MGNPFARKKAPAPAAPNPEAPTETQTNPTETQTNPKAETAMVLSRLGPLVEFMGSSGEGDREVVRLVRAGGSKGFLFIEPDLCLDLSIVGRDDDSGDGMGAKLRCMVLKVRSGEPYASADGSKSDVPIEAGDSIVIGESRALQDLRGAELPLDVRIMWHRCIKVTKGTFWDISLGLLRPLAPGEAPPF